MSASTTTDQKRVTPALPPRPKQQAAASPVALYKQARNEGAGHDRAIEVEWLAANGQPLRIFRPRTEADVLSIGGDFGGVITLAG
jgi:hypothetical protein